MRKFVWQKQTIETKCGYVLAIFSTNSCRYFDMEEIVTRLGGIFTGFKWKGKHLSALLNSLYAQGKIGRKLKTNADGTVIPGYYVWIKG